MLKKTILDAVSFIILSVLSLRYRIRVIDKNPNETKKLKETGGILFLPSHPAEMDPVFVSAIVWKYFNTRPRPLAVEHFYYLKGIILFMKFMKAIPIVHLEGPVSRWKEKKIQKVQQLIKDELKKGENFLIYPAGRLKLSASEVLGGASMVHNLVHHNQDVNVVLIRTEGLWGSRFSRALTGASPSFAAMAWQGVKLILKNGIFFAPRRTVEIEIFSNPKDLPKDQGRLEFNQYLEKWYNIHGPEKLSLVSDYFWKKSFPAVIADSKEKKEKQKDAFNLSPALKKEVLEKIAEISKKPAQDITTEMSLARDLALDSLDSAQLQVFLEERYRLNITNPAEIETVEDVFRAVSKKGEKVDEGAYHKETLQWPSESNRPPLSKPKGKTFQESFLRICDEMSGFALCSDAVVNKVLTYKDFKFRALVLAHHLKSIDDKYIGVLLPSTATTYIVIFAILLAGKVPVMLNWTAGPRSLDHCAEMFNLKTILSSRKFLNNLSVLDLGELDESLLLLEDVKEKITLRSTLKGFRDTYKKADALLKSLDLERIAEEDSVVILFTSGTESFPKAVPLSHRNILSNQEGVLIRCDFLTEQEIMYGVLPSFHSFGFVISGTLPVLIGMRVYYAPDPTDSSATARGIEKSQATMVCLPPTFFRGVIQVAKEGQLDSLRYLVTGAEKMPSDLADKFLSLGKDKIVLEGYGATECSPIVSSTYPGVEAGVGKPFPGIEVCIIDQETGLVLDQPAEGELCVYGPNVFSGYIGQQKSPFIEISGKKWYRSGDRAYIDAQGCIILTGRLKRFVKIGAEMISLGGLESEIASLCEAHSWDKGVLVEGPKVAIVAKEKESEKSTITLFTTFEITKEEVNTKLASLGYGGLVRISEVKKIDQIPVTGAGKTNHRFLEGLL